MTDNEIELLSAIKKSQPSRRDYFAAAALTGLISSYVRTVEQDSQLAYKYADAMIAESEKQPTKET